jgi:hypothetical protein
MSMLKKLILLKRIDWHIGRKSTGTPAPQFANKLRIAPSSLYGYIRELKEEWNAPIAYSEVENCYYYTESYSFENALLKILKDF